ncbi:hypothetical protein ACHAQJ_004809 [Trichoderma viride]
MSLTCGLFRRRSKSEEKKPQRTRTFSIFDPSLDALRRMIKNATMISPTRFPDEPTLSRAGSLTREHSMTPAMLEIMESVYNELRSNEPQLSKAAFVKFLLEVQGQAMVQLDKEKYNVGEFLYVLAHDWDAARKPSEKDYSKPITNYFINSSHNTYISGNQLASKTSPEAYMNVLKRGGRCIEIDVWNGDEILVTVPKSPAGGNHTRAISGSALPYAAAVVFETMEEKIESAKDAAKNYLGNSNPDGRSRSRSPSSHSRTTTDDGSSRSSDAFLPDGGGLTEKLEVPRLSRTRQNLPRGEPIVTHGWTFTTPCGFREVCETIRDHAFAHGNDLPIIISLEVHADHNQQEVMARIMREVWGDMLVQQPFEGCDPKFRVPTLDDLRCKILVKVKRAVAKMPRPEDLTASMPVLPAEEDGSTSDDEPHPPRLRATASSPAGIPQQDENGKMTICKPLSDLAIYTRSERFKSLSTPQAKQPTHIFSISEDRIMDLHEKYPREVFTHNKNFFMRAFPAGRRINSSNPDPSLFWRRGVQMVAMNWQNMDEGMMINEAMFAGEDGWVLKPAAYQGSDKAMVTLDLAAKHTLDFSITVFAGRNIPTEDHDKEDSPQSRAALCPRVKAELHIGEGDKDGHEHSYKHHTKAAKTSDPVWKASGEKLQFHNIPKVVEELSFIRLKVEDASHTVSQPCLAWACIRLDRLQRGFRFIRLHSRKGCEIDGGKLLVKIEKVLR